ncbi:hypothetical protein [Streptomyces anulatus]|uniref:Uncharacterized protein n=1 Tax=Streptomyces anulatus TaxID=1892 RepID=A0ABZ1ZT06_STRAQ|nr:hypothetical protein [Streptomyces anulatus]
MSDENNENNENEPQLLDRLGDKVLGPQDHTAEAPSLEGDDANAQGRRSSGRRSSGGYKDPYANK